MSGDKFKLYFAELSADYGRQLPAKFAELESLWDCVVTGTASPEWIGALQRELHALVGTAQTMGFPAVTDAARTAETYLASLLACGTVPDSDGQEELGRLLAKLKQSARMEP